MVVWVPILYYVLVKRPDALISLKSEHFVVFWDMPRDRPIIFNGFKIFETPPTHIPPKPYKLRDKYVGF